MTARTIARVTLDPAERAAVSALLAAANAHDGAAFTIGEPPPDDTQPRHFLRYAGETLCGWAMLLGDDTIEVSGVVHPDQRRQHHGAALLAAVREACAARGHDAFLLVCDAAVPAGAAFAVASGSAPSGAEYQLTLDPSRVPPARPLATPLAYRHATAADGATIGTILATAFGDPPEGTSAWVARDIARPQRQWLLATFGATPVATLRLLTTAEALYLTAFAVAPAFQGRGLGRAVLLRGIAQVRDCDLPVRIEVDHDNASALALYQSCGFVISRSYAYFRLTTR